MENQHKHPLLAQIPLTKSPFFNPPKPVTLPSSYKVLPLQVPETRITKENLESWIKEIDSVKIDITNYGDSELESYKEWNNKVVKKLAPGYFGGDNTLLIPHKREDIIKHEKESELQKETNDIDRAFSTLNI